MLGLCGCLAVVVKVILRRVCVHVNLRPYVVCCNRGGHVLMPVMVMAAGVVKTILLFLLTLSLKWCKRFINLWLRKIKC